MPKSYRSPHPEADAAAHAEAERIGYALAYSEHCAVCNPEPDADPVSDANGDELEHGAPDFPGQFPEPDAATDLDGSVQPDPR